MKNSLPQVSLKYLFVECTARVAESACSGKRGACLVRNEKHNKRATNERLVCLR